MRGQPSKGKLPANPAPPSMRHISWTLALRPLEPHQRILASAIVVELRDDLERAYTGEPVSDALLGDMRGVIRDRVALERYRGFPMPMLDVRLTTGQHLALTITDEAGPPA